MFLLFFCENAIIDIGALISTQNWKKHYHFNLFRR